MKRIFLIILILSLGAFAVSIFGSSRKSPKPTIRPPKNWEVMKIDTSSKSKEIFRFESKEIDTEKVADGNFTTNAVIRVIATDKYKNLDDFGSQYKASGSKNDQFKILSSSKIKSGDNDGQLLETTFNVEVKSQKILVHQIDYLYYKDGYSFLVEGYSSNSSWDKHSPEIKASLNSFKFN